VEVDEHHHARQLSGHEGGLGSVIATQAKIEDRN
jgi:hypothetical protein